MNPVRPKQEDKTSRNLDESYSQWGEDRMVWSHFGHRAHGTFFEAGAFHPVRLSQTYFLEQRGWHGVLVDPLPDSAAEFARIRTNSLFFQNALGSPEDEGRDLAFVIPQDGTVAHLRQPHEIVTTSSRITKVRSTTINSILAKSSIQQVDYLSLDLEGNELAALRGLDFARWKPQLILIEDHFHSLNVHRYLKTHDYKLVFRLGCNNWYLPAGDTCQYTTRRVQLELFRKMYLSMPFRKLSIMLKGLRASGRSASC